MLTRWTELNQMSDGDREEQKRRGARKWVVLDAFEQTLQTMRPLPMPAPTTRMARVATCFFLAYIVILPFLYGWRTKKQQQQQRCFRCLRCFRCVRGSGCRYWGLRTFSSTAPQRAFGWVVQCSQMDRDADCERAPDDGV